MQTNCASWKGKQKRDTLEKMSFFVHMMVC